MNPEQAKGTVRWIITTFGPFIIQNGWASASTLEMIGGIIVTVAPWIWSLFTHTEKNAVTVVDAIAQKPESSVKAVVMEPTQAGREIADSIPGNTTVVAGTPAATSIAKAT
jgi:hypothetical protein